MRKLTLKPVEDNDVSLLDKWLHKDYILKWYHEPKEWIKEIEERNGSFNFLKHYIVFDGKKPVGFCQYYDCFEAKEEWYEVEAPGKFYSIDYLIGEEDYLRKGYGKEIVKILLKTILQDKNPQAIIVQPEKENIASCKTLLASGFIYDNNKNYYRLSVK